jgi:hypothetical protein
MPRIDPIHSVIMLEGTTAFGTQAAVEYVCRGYSVAELLKEMCSFHPQKN